jgi:hypothetical protein
LCQAPATSSSSTPSPKVKNSFGFSVGDSVAVGNLISEIVTSLQSVDGARSEYQELIWELESLQTLRHLYRLNHGGSSSEAVESIKFAALSCRIPLDDFLAKSNKYEKSLGPWNRAHSAQATVKKIGWTFGAKEDIRRMQRYLNIHVGTINMLLAQFGHEQMVMNDKNAEARIEQIQEQMDKAQSILGNMNKDMPAQTMLVRSMHSMLSGLYQLIRGELTTSFQHFNQVVNKVW